MAAAVFLALFRGMALAANDGISVDNSVDRAGALVGDRIKLTFEIGYRSGTEINFPEFKEGKIGDFEIKDFAREVSKKLFRDAFVMKRIYRIAAYSTGKRQIPRIEIRYKVKGDKEWKSVYARVLNVTIESVLPKGKLPADIKDVKPPLGYFELNPVLIAGIVILFLAVALGVFFKLRKKPLPVRLPHEIAAEELEAIRGNFLRDPDVKEYYAGISDCVRRYIERVFKLRAPEMTTEEFLSSLHMSVVLSIARKDLLRDFLNACDLVKFAKYTPVRGETDAVFVTAKKFIDTSTAG
ncbi:MAG: hypothetical protein Q7S07_02430 [Candidatus Omnitrophota bacterium]|nr:hypothetical protein [Candidatus Omnitrophota bacterium]